MCSDDTYAYTYAVMYARNDSLYSIYNYWRKNFLSMITFI